MPSDYGMTRAPKTFGQFDSAMASRDFIERLDCRDRLLELMRANHPFAEIVALIRQEHPGKSEGTIRQYTTLYRTFFMGRGERLIPPLRPADEVGVLALHSLTPKRMDRPVRPKALLDMEWTLEIMNRAILGDAATRVRFGARPALFATNRASGS